MRRGLVFFDGERAGRLEETETGMSFRYDPTWLAAPGARPVSLTMPLRAEPYASRGPMPFFMGLLPEGWLLDIALAKLKVARDDAFGMLLALCHDCIGAVSIEPDRKVGGDG